MLVGLSEKVVPYICEKDRTSDSPTVFYIKPMSVEAAIETSAGYVRAKTIDRRKGREGVDSAAIVHAEQIEFSTAVKKVENLAIPQSAPNNVFDHFLMKSEKEPSKYKKIKVENVFGAEEEAVLIVETEELADIKNIYLALTSDVQKEVNDVASDLSKLKEGIRSF